VVVGLFVKRPLADAYARRVPSAEVVPLATRQVFEQRYFATAETSDDERQMRIRHVVEIATEASAYDSADVERAEAELEAKPWARLPVVYKWRAAALAKASPRCTLAAGRTFLIDGRGMNQHSRQYVPVTCDDGHDAWVPWRATRFESAVVVTRTQTEVHQVIVVECDTPTVETRPFGRVPDGLGPVTDASCN
jgi:hypothetical protein